MLSETELQTTDAGEEASDALTRAAHRALAIVCSIGDRASPRTLRMLAKSGDTEVRPDPCATISSMEEDIVTFDQLDRCDLRFGSILAGGSGGNYGDEPIHHALPVGIQGGIRYSRVDGSVRMVVLYSTMSDPEWPDHLDRRTGRLTYYGDNKVPGRPLLDTTPGGNAMLAELDAMGFATAAQRSKWPPILVFTKAVTAGLSGWSRRFEGLFAPDTTDGTWLLARHFDSAGGSFENFVLRLRRLDTAIVPRVWLDSLVSSSSVTADPPSAVARWIQSGNIS